MTNQTLIADYEAAAEKATNPITAASYREAAAGLRRISESETAADIDAQVLTAAQLIAILDTTEEGREAGRISLETYFPEIGTSAQFSGSECVDRLNEWWGNLGGDFEEDDDEEDVEDVDDAASEVNGETLTQCESCDAIRPEHELDPIRDLNQRVEPGEPLPAGECPSCGALCHRIAPTAAAEELPSVEVAGPTSSN